MKEPGSSEDRSKPNQNNSKDQLVLSDGRIVRSKKKNDRPDMSAAAVAAAIAAKEEKKAQEEAAKQARADRREAMKAQEEARKADKKARAEADRAEWEAVKAARRAKKEEAKAKKAAEKQAKIDKAAADAQAKKEAKEAKKAALEAEKAKKAAEKAAKKSAGTAAKSPSAPAVSAETASASPDSVPAEASPAAESPASDTPTESTPILHTPHDPDAIVLQDGRELKSGKLRSSGKRSGAPRPSGKKKKKSRKQARRTLLIRIGLLLAALFLVFMIAGLPFGSNGQPGTEEMTGTDLTETETETETESETEETETTRSIKGQLQTTAESTVPTTERPTKTPGWAKGKRVPFSMVFTGDLNPSELLTIYEEQGISSLIDEDLRSEMKDSALTMINQEFACGTGGVKQSDKPSTYRVDTKYLSILEEMGVDLVNLANDHSLDYGKDLLSQNFRNLEEAGIDYVGAGSTAEQASQWKSYTFGKTNVAVIAASRVIPTADWNVEKSTPGVFSTYDPAKINEQITAAREENDIVIVYVHWGIEKSSIPEPYQQELAHSYIDAGADLVIGSHPHVLQGIEYYEGKPIIYSLGSFIFHENNTATAMLKVNVSRFKKVQLQLIPCTAVDAQTRRAMGPEAQEILKHIQDLSDGAKISRSGIISKG